MIHISKATRPRKLPKITTYERSLSLAFRAAIRAAGEATSEDELARALERRDVAGAVAAVRWDQVQEMLAESLPKRYRAVWTASAEQTSRQLGSALRKAATPPTWSFGAQTSPLDWILQHTGTLIQEWGAASREALQALIRAAFERGIDTRSLARLIRESGIGLTEAQAEALARRRAQLEAGGMEAGRAERAAARYAAQLLRQRAETIARTEVISAQVAAQQQIWIDAVEQGFLDPETARQVWSYTPRNAAQPCEICAPLDGTEARLGEPFGKDGQGRDIYGPTAHPNCLTGDTLVAIVGEVSAATRRWYEGDLIVLRTAAGHQLACTPNHPILTDHGWVAAGLLNIGDHVVSLSRGHWVAMRDGQHEHVPARVQEIARAFEDFHFAKTATVPVAPEDFHGDGIGSEVAVVRSNGLLRDGVQPSFVKHSPEVSLSVVHAPETLDGKGVSTSGVKAALGAPGCNVGRSGLSESLLGRHALPPHGLGLACVTQANARTNEAALDGASAGSVVLGEGEDGLPAIVSLDKLVRVGRVPHSGHVYNLESPQDELYIGNGLIVHNCRCSLNMKP